jgi:hypothetical protein
LFNDTSRSIPCDDYDSRNATSTSKGSLVVTCLDLAAGIVSGTFDFTIAKPGCDTLKVTQGRFDGKF